jgi:hypothetical protein
MPQYAAPTVPRMPDPGSVDFSNPEQTKAFMVNLVASIARALVTRPAQTTPQLSRLFTSPNGTTYEMTLDDAGAPSFTAVNKKTELPP